jgi:hypothetical protein
MAQSSQMNEPVHAPQQPVSEPVTAESMSIGDDDDETMSYFAKLANDG